MHRRRPPLRRSPPPGTNTEPPGARRLGYRVCAKGPVPGTRPPPARHLPATRPPPAIRPAPRLAAQCRPYHPARRGQRPWCGRSPPSGARPSPGWPVAFRRESDTLDICRRVASEQCRARALCVRGIGGLCEGEFRYRFIGDNVCYGALATSRRPSSATVWGARPRPAFGLMFGRTFALCSPWCSHRKSPRSLAVRLFAVAPRSIG
jgi:hypothetical protein